MIIDGLARGPTEPRNGLFGERIRTLHGVCDNRMIVLGIVFQSRPHIMPPPSGQSLNDVAGYHRHSKPVRAPTTSPACMSLIGLSFRVTCFCFSGLFVWNIRPSTELRDWLEELGGGVRLEGMPEVEARRDSCACFCCAGSSGGRSDSYFCFVGGDWVSAMAGVEMREGSCLLWVLGVCASGLLGCSGVCTGAGCRVYLAKLLMCLVILS
jgi:hypothetical protein